jgi:DNA ligase-1
MKILPTLAASVTMEEAKELFTDESEWFGFFKYDGIRAMGHPKLGLVSRRLKPIPNLKVREKFRRCTWLDGELIFGKPTDKDCYNLTESCVMTKNGSVSDGVFFYIFDWFKDPTLPYTERRRKMELHSLFGVGHDIFFAPMYPLKDYKALLAFEKKAVKLGYEGIMMRRADGIYKMRRSTVKEGILIKLKRFQDSEAQVLEVYPRQKNTNKLEKDERGYAKRSSHKAGKVDLEELGGFKVRDTKTKIVFDCGPGVLTQEERRRLWKKRHLLLDQAGGKVIKYRFQPAGVKDKPRFPRFVGWRSRVDF